MPYHSSKNKTTRYSTNLSNSTALSTADKVKALDIVMYSSPNCFFCIQFKNLLKNDNLERHIIIIEDQMQIPSEVQAFPFLKSRKTGKHIVGAPKSIDAMIDDLQ